MLQTFVQEAYRSGIGLGVPLNLRKGWLPGPSLLPAGHAFRYDCFSHRKKAVNIQRVDQPYRGCLSLPAKLAGLLHSLPFFSEAYKFAIK
jgi:hypothetical protein